VVASSLDALDEHLDERLDRRPYARTENLSALCVNLSKLLQGRGKFVLVLDAVDKLREGGGTLVAALGRLGESVRPEAHGNDTMYISDPSHRYLTSH
jgi:origin recognition complex subunit 5